LSESYLIIYTILFFLGLILGSFFNVLIIRLPKNKKGILSGRSYCPNCKKKIKWFDNLPIISFIILKGKCRKCKKKISFQYPLLEWFSAISFIFLFYYFDNYFEALYFQIIILILIAIFLIDLRYSIIPNELNYTLIIIAFLQIFILNFESFFIKDINQALIGGTLGYGIIWLIIFLYDKLRNIEAMGFGDAKLMAAIGIFFGWKSIPFVLFFASIIGLLMVIPSLITKNKKFKNSNPLWSCYNYFGYILFFKGNLIYQLLLF
jgi:leader peptidase (prepilin peptidase)/N-methyltransferase